MYLYFPILASTLFCSITSQGHSPNPMLHCCGCGFVWPASPVSEAWFGCAESCWEVDRLFHVLLHLRISKKMEVPHIAPPKPANVARRTERTACTWSYRSRTSNRFCIRRKTSNYLTPKTFIMLTWWLLKANTVQYLSVVYSSSSIVIAL